MKVTFIGTGDAFTKKIGHNSALVEFGDTNLVLDFPATNYALLDKMGKSLIDIKNIFITHLHEDHYNGLQQFAHYHNIFRARGEVKEKPNLYIAETLLEELWDALKTGLRKSPKGELTLSDYFNVYPVKDTFEIEGVTFKIYKTNHIPDMLSYGILAEGYFYFSGDSNVDVELLQQISDKVKYIFHDCHLYDLEISSHASLNDIMSLDQNIKRKIVIMHYPDKFAEEEQSMSFLTGTGMFIALPNFVWNFN